MLTKILLAIVGRSADSIVHFVIRLDAKLEAYLAAHNADVAAIEDEIEQTRQNAEAHVAELRQEIADRTAKANVVQAIKSSLPTA